MDRRYRCVEEVAAHSATRTYVCRAETVTGKTVCVKKQHFVTAEERNEAFLSQSLQKALEHSNVLKVHKSFAGEEDGHFLATEMEWGGNDLEQITKTKSQKGEFWSVDDLLLLLKSITDALAYAQRMGICHRDIKPSNIFLPVNNTFKIGDFGCAKSTDPGREMHSIVGTPVFFSPELRGMMARREGEAVYDPFKSDVYSLGLTVLYLAKRGVGSMFGSGEKVAEMVDGLNFHPKLKETLNLMLSQSETQRPDFVELLPIVNATYTTVAGAATTELISKPPAKVSKNQLITPAQRPTPDFIPPSKDRKECFACGRSFHPDPTAPWRAVHSSEFIDSLCSEQCFAQQTFGTDSAEHGRSDGENARKCVQCNATPTEFYFLTCRKHVVCVSHVRDGEGHTAPFLFVVCKFCPRRKFTEICYGFKPFLENEIDKNVVFIPIAGNFTEVEFIPVHKSTAKLTETAQCHFCASPVTANCCFVPHNELPAFACSQQCILRKFPFSKSRLTCPTCQQDISPLVIEAALLGLLQSLTCYQEDVCRICKVRKTTTVFQCGHGTCDRCFAEMWVPVEGAYFPCNRCGLAIEKEQYGDLFLNLSLI